MNTGNQWEYRVVRVKPSGIWKLQPDPEEIEEQLNRLGRDGWERVGAVEGSGVISPAFCLKRRT